MWPCGSRLLTSDSRHQMTDMWIPPLRRRGWSPSPALSSEGAGGRQSSLREPPAMGPELLQQLVTCCCWKSRVQRPGREAGLPPAFSFEYTKEKTVIALAGPSLIPHQAEVSEEERKPTVQRAGAASDKAPQAAKTFSGWSPGEGPDHGPVTVWARRKEF